MNSDWRVYFSHTWEDSELALRVIASLSKAGLQVIDPEAGMSPGENRALQIGKALEKAKAIVVLVTPSALKSAWVRHDIDYALSTRRFKDAVIPVIAEPIDEGEMPWILRTKMDPIDLVKDGNVGMKRLIERLKGLASGNASATP